MALEFLNDLYPYVFILSGVFAVWLGLDRLFNSDETGEKDDNPDNDESKLLRWIGAILSLLLFAMLVLLILNDAVITNYSAFFTFLLSLSMIARPLKKIPVAFVISTIVGLVIFYLVLNSSGDIPIFGSIELKWLVIGVIIIVILIFIIGFMQEKIMDTFLIVLGWAPIIVVLGVTLAVQGVTLLLEYPDVDGILGSLPG